MAVNSAYAEFVLTLVPDVPSVFAVSAATQKGDIFIELRQSEKGELRNGLK
jgi:hypothetical protein